MPNNNQKTIKKKSQTFKIISEINEFNRKIKFLFMYGRMVRDVEFLA